MCRKDSFKLLQKIEFVQSILKKKRWWSLIYGLHFQIVVPTLLL